MNKRKEYKMERENLGILAPLFKSINKLRRKNTVRILMYHDVPFDEINLFEEQIDFLIRNGYQFLDLNSFIEFLSGKIENRNHRYIFLTFDDGFYSNYYVAKLLSQKDISAHFFLSSSFINGTYECDQQSYIKDNFFPESEKVEKLKTLKPLNVNQIKEMINLKHTIGSHTENHIRLSESENAKVKDELRNSKEILEKMFDVKVNSFAYPFGDITSIGKKELCIAKNEYEYVFSGIRGFNYKNTNKACIRRDEISIHYSLKYFDFIIEGGFDIKYFNPYKKLLDMLEYETERGIE